MLGHGLMVVAPAPGGQAHETSNFFLALGDSSVDPNRYETAAILA